MLGITIEQTRVYQEAKAEGREEGRAEGREEGREEGRAEGLAEGELSGKLQTVPLLVETGLSIEEIATRIGVDLETVRQAAQTEPTDR
jgi:predicted transposase YdaD